MSHALPAIALVVGPLYLRSTMAVPPPPEVILTPTRYVSCDGATAIRGGPTFKASALGHPKVYLTIDEHGYVDCGYCDRRFVLEGGPADGADQSQLRDIADGTDPGYR